jgi:lantibiotic modifying enzyme
MSSEEFLEAAVAIGRRIAAAAVWHDGCCGWVGASAAPAGRGRIEYRPVGHDVYDGTAGIGLFLALLGAAADQSACRRAAAGALRHGLARAELHDGHGLYAGTPGVAWAAAQAAGLLRDAELAVRSRALAEAVAVPEPGHGSDLTDGAAGTAVALLGAAAAFGDTSLAARATDVGETVLQGARITRNGWSWAHPARRYPSDPCGVAHGAAGIGWALLELFAATGDERFADGAAGAFAYERSWLDEDSGAWPDLRMPMRGDHHPSEMTGTWCYGEAGIALSRLRAVELLREGPHCLDANISIATTRRHLEEELPFALEDLSLCHGAGGAADALITAGEADAAVALGRVAIERYGARGEWPCGVEGTTPGLFRGLSGIGWLFLRLYDRSVPSPLALPRAVDNSRALSIA